MAGSIDASEMLRFAKDISAAGDQLLPLARVIIQKSAQDIKATAQRYAPVDTGYLMNSITYETGVDSGGVWGEIGPTAEYGAYVEFGTTRQAPQLYMTGAFDKHVPAIEAALDQAVARLL